MRVICVADTNMLVSKKLCVPNANPNHPNANCNQPIDTPNANNIVPVGHVDFVLFVLFFLRWVPNVNAVSVGIRA